MRKLLLIPAALVLSTGFTFAQPLTLNQTGNVTQQIGNTYNGGFAKNSSYLLQAQVPVNVWNGALSQSATVNQTIGNTYNGGTAINRSTVIQAQVPLNFGAP
ncbi:hypothetical protein [Methylocystis echinoides]|jgi:hypothetical protein|uniref:hypothetical protein n=1 Tax=Methylocystis echinoides TaxID=29468 RepID=UPI0034368E23